MFSSANVSDVVLIFVPALLVVVVGFFLVKKFLDNDYKLKLLEAKRSAHKDILPLRLQAYERLTLFIERISPNHLLVRVHRAGMTSKELHSELIATVRSEYEHNLSQQIYISSKAWEAIKTAKEDMVRIINAAAAGMIDRSATDLSKEIFAIMMKTEKIPTQKALEIIKNEAKELF